MCSLEDPKDVEVSLTLLLPACLPSPLTGILLRRLLQDLLVLPLRVVPDEPRDEDQEEPSGIWCGDSAVHHQLGWPVVCLAPGKGSERRRKTALLLAEPRPTLLSSIAHPVPCFVRRLASD